MTDHAILTNPALLSDETFLRIKTIRRVRALLQREKQIYLRVLYSRCGVGLTVNQFDSIVKAIAESGWCSLKTGALGAVSVIFNEHFNSVNLPEVTDAQ